MRASGRSWKASQLECEDIGESLMDIEIINRKSEFNDDRRYFEQMHNNNLI
jgi:hypothetical protein